MRRLLAAGTGLAAALAAVTGCSAPSATTAPAGTVPPLRPAACPSPSASAAVRWPASIPAGLPRPAGATDLTTQQDGPLSITKFVSPTSLQRDVLLVLHQLPAAGFVVGRGDAEYAEADVPFERAGVHGQIRLSALTPCQTLWLVATQRGTSSGLVLPSRGGSPAPLTTAPPQPFAVTPTPSSGH